MTKGEQVPVEAGGAVVDVELVVGLVVGAEVGLPEEEPHPKATLLICHVVVVEEKVDQTKPVMALVFAPEN